MTKTEINIGEEIINFFKTLKPLIKPPDRNILLRQLWEPVMDKVSINEKVKIYHCFCAYEKAHFQFEENDINLGLNSIDYADYHSFEIEGIAKALLTVLREQALALYHYQIEQYPEALEKLKESENSMKDLEHVVNSGNYLQTIQDYLFVLLCYATGEYKIASGKASELITLWAAGSTGEENKIDFPDNVEAQRPNVIHYLTDGILLCVHNVCGDNEELVEEQLENIFSGFRLNTASTCPVEGYERTVRLLFAYNDIDDLNTYVPSLIDLFLILTGIPVFIQYYLFKKLIRIMESIDYPQVAAITHELERYFSYLGIGRSASLKKDRTGFIKEEI